MKLLEKIEVLLNTFLIKLAELMWKLVPESVKRLFIRISSHYRLLVGQLKKLPVFLKTKFLALIQFLRSFTQAFNFKKALDETYKKAITQYKQKSPAKNGGHLKTLLMTPFLMLGQWLQGLSASQSMLLLTFSAGSFLAVLGIFFSGQRLVSGQADALRSPASVEEEIQYERPDYYKKQTKHFSIVNLRLPVYVAKVNEIKSVDVDFTATLTNRYSRMFLEKNEFQLRDHLILQMEPSVAAFPLEEEGKVIIREKLLSEINDFLIQNEVNGEVVELKITYVLAN